ncbi:hypothetical protein [Stenotrophomonas sp.]|uniref:hypothetical protein n=1 Tax=Stenotrophomonas sp. TaxID=69392 RepID=UPI0019B8FA8D|nr:hypothetical protein [Stenotrophomonas sp.]MBD3825631.1 hypothetical protein [Stenotrophomonas sp.]
MSAFTAQTLHLPRGEDAMRPDATPPKAFTGFVVGPFFCHHVYSDDETTLMGANGDSEIGDWQVTHTASGANVVRGLRSAFRAIWLAEKLSAFAGCHEVTFQAVLDGTATVGEEIRNLRHEARWGRCQGLCNFSFFDSTEGHAP